MRSLALGLLLAATPTQALAAVLRPLDVGGCVVDSGKAEYVFYLGPQTGLTTLRSPAGQTHRLACTLSSPAVDQVCELLGGSPGANPYSSAELRELSVWFSSSHWG